MAPTRRLPFKKRDDNDKNNDDDNNNDKNNNNDDKNNDNGKKEKQQRQHLKDKKIGKTFLLKDNEYVTQIIKIPNPPSLVPRHHNKTFRNMN